MSPFDIPSKQNELKNLEKETLDSNFWNNPSYSSKILAKIKGLKSKIEAYTLVQSEFRTIQEMNSLLLQEVDEEMAKELIADTTKLENKLETLEVSTLFSGSEYIFLANCCASVDAPLKVECTTLSLTAPNIPIGSTPSCL